MSVEFLRPEVSVDAPRVVLRLNAKSSGEYNAKDVVSRTYKSSTFLTMTETIEVKDPTSNVLNQYEETFLPVTETVTTTWFIMAFLVISLMIGTRKVNKRPRKFQVFLEMMYNGFYNFTKGTLGNWNKKFLPYVGTLMTFLIVANTISFFPIPAIRVRDGKMFIEAAFKNPTSDLNTTVGLALVTTLIFLYWGIKQKGIFGYVKGLASPIAIMLPMNIVGEVSKPLNISMRLFGNMFGGIVIMGLLYRYAPWIIPAPLHLYFDIFAGVIQSLIFTMLTMVYISDSVEGTEPEVA